jgi:peroxiredoxin
MGRFLWGLAVATAVAAAVVVWWLGQGVGSEAPRAIPLGEQVESFQLEDVASGKVFSLADHLGQGYVVIVSYMGWFCTGCAELLVELQRRQQEFQGRGATLVAIGSQPESLETARRSARAAGITYPLLYDADAKVTRRLGLWSEYMDMPFMGYVIISPAGRIVAGEQVLAEHRGAAPANVDRVLAALDRAREAGAGAPR